MSRDDRISDYLRAIVIAKNKLRRHEEHFDEADRARAEKDHEHLQAIMQNWPPPEPAES
jgi:hypothetical protein